MNYPVKIIPALGVLSDINIFRVHDVWQNKQAIDVAYAIKKS